MLDDIWTICRLSNFNNFVWGSSVRMVRERLKPAAHVRNEQNSSQASHSSILSSSLGADILRNTARIRRSGKHQACFILSRLPHEGRKIGRFVGANLDRGPYIGNSLHRKQFLTWRRELSIHKPGCEGRNMFDIFLFASRSQCPKKTCPKTLYMYIFCQLSVKQTNKQS